MADTHYLKIAIAADMLEQGIVCEIVKLLAAATKSHRLIYIMDVNNLQYDDTCILIFYPNIEPYRIGENMDLFSGIESHKKFYRALIGDRKCAKEFSKTKLDALLRLSLKIGAKICTEENDYAPPKPIEKKIEKLKVDTNVKATVKTKSFDCADGLTASVEKQVGHPCNFRTLKFTPPEEFQSALHKIRSESIAQIQVNVPKGTETSINTFALEQLIYFQHLVKDICLQFICMQKFLNEIPPDNPMRLLVQEFLESAKKSEFAKGLFSKRSINPA